MRIIIPLLTCFLLGTSVLNGIVLAQNQDLTSLAISRKFLNAVEANDVAEVESLVNSGVSAAGPHNRCTLGHPCWEIPLIRASLFGHKEMVELLLQNGAVADARNEAGNTAFIKAADVGEVEIMKLLLTHGADINAQNAEGKTALMVGKEKAVRFLLEHSANLELQDRLGARAITWAIHAGDIGKLQLLLEKGADVNILIPPSSHTLEAFIPPSKRVCVSDRSEFDDAKWMAATRFPLILLFPSFYTGTKSCHLTVDKAKYPQGFSNLDLAKELKDPDIIRLMEKHGAKSGRKL